MYGNVYEADHKLQVTYGFFSPRGGGGQRRGDECTVAVNARELIAAR